MVKKKTKDIIKEKVAKEAKKVESEVKKIPKARTKAKKMEAIEKVEEGTEKMKEIVEEEKAPAKKKKEKKIVEEEKSPAKKKSSAMKKKEKEISKENIDLEKNKKKSVVKTTRSIKILEIDKGVTAIVGIMESGFIFPMGKVRAGYRYSNDDSTVHKYTFAPITAIKRVLKNKKLFPEGKIYVIQGTNGQFPGMTYECEIVGYEGRSDDEIKKYNERFENGYGIFEKAKKFVKGGDSVKLTEEEKKDRVRNAKDSFANSKRIKFKTGKSGNVSLKKLGKYVKKYSKDKKFLGYDKKEKK